MNCLNKMLEMQSIKVDQNQSVYNRDFIQYYSSFRTDKYVWNQVSRPIYRSMEAGVFKHKVAIHSLKTVFDGK